MKVKVTYTIDLEDIPQLVKSIVIKNKEILCNVIEDSERISSNGADLGPKSLKIISNMRKELESLLEGVFDCEQLLGGYLHANLSTEGVDGLLDQATDIQNKLGEIKDDVELRED